MKCIQRISCDYLDEEEFIFEDGKSFKVTRFEIFQHMQTNKPLKELLMKKYFEMLAKHTKELDPEIIKLVDKNFWELLA